MALNVLTVVTNLKLPVHRLKEKNMTPEEGNIFGAFTENPLAPLEGVPTYKYMENLNVYLNPFLSAVYCTIGCGTLGYLFLRVQPAVFNTHCGKSGHSSSHTRPNSNGYNFPGLIRIHKH